MTLRCLFLRGRCVSCGVYSSLWLKLLWPSAFWYAGAASSNVCLSDESVEMRLLMDVGRNKEACPLQNKCMNKDIVYKATISTSNANDTKHYIGMTSSTFKERYRNHIKSFTHKKYSNETELSKHIWHLKLNKTDFTIKWSIIKKSISYTGGSKRCNLCLEEKLNILKEKDNCLLNKRSEIISACQHKNRFQVKSLNKERNACYFNDNTPTFPPWA